MINNLEELKNVQLLSLCIWIVSPNANKPIYMNSFYMREAEYSSWIELTSDSGRRITSTFGFANPSDGTRIFSDEESANKYNQQLIERRKRQYAKTQ